jgi:hypothetical protein
MIGFSDKDSLRKSDFHFGTFLFIIRDQGSTPAAVHFRSARKRAAR